MSTKPTPQQISATALRKELDTIIELAEWGIANERLGGNVCKEEHWKGQRFAATQVLQWLELTQHEHKTNTPDHTNVRTGAIGTQP